MQMRVPSLSIISLTLCWAACSTSTPEAPEYTFPAEWEPHAAVWLTYTGDPMDTVVDHMVRNMDPSIPVVCFIRNDSLLHLLWARWDSLGIDTAGHRFPTLEPHDSLGINVVRDVGPIHLRHRDGSLAILNYKFTSYGDFTNIRNQGPGMLALRDTIHEFFARKQGLPMVHTDMCIEGGSIDVNGNGMLVTTAAVMEQRNPGWTRPAMEAELGRVLGVRKVIWLEQGVANDAHAATAPRVFGNVFSFGTGGHVDEVCRFVNDSTVLLAWPDDADLHDTIQQITRQRMEVNLEILRKARLADGRPLRVVQVPMPDMETRPWVLDTAKKYSRKHVEQYPDMQHGDTVQMLLANSYLNFLITNGRVFVPAYWHEGLPESLRAKDERVQAVLREAFPDRRIVALDPRALNRYGGGMHCWSQQQPKAMAR
ncbi:MAG: agmatine deiminase family protein [Flavobacteriales bacterium]|nr:agmatine deiminase family protein [Flavobacteriales bacterium]